MGAFHSAMSAAVLCVVAGVGNAHAVDLFRVSGRVATTDQVSPEGVEVDLFLDLNRDGERHGLETVRTQVNADGTYRAVLAVDPRDVDLDDLTFASGLVGKYRNGGFPALLGDSPLVAVVRFERAGYGGVSRRLAVTIGELTADAVLAPLAPVGCTNDACTAGDGSLRLEGLSPELGIVRAYAAAGDPVFDRVRFPGAFADSDGALLRSTAFAEIQLWGDAGNEIHTLSAPVTVKMAIARRAWATLPDLEPGNDRVDLPMYSFERSQGQWVRETNGWLVDADGEIVDEGALAAIRAGTAEGDYFVAFTTDHFSSFNCDEPIDARACVRGRLVDAEGNPLAGANVDLEGDNYVGSAGTVTTGPRGDFAGDVLRSEAPGEDHDQSGVRGETFRARVQGSVADGYFIGEPFETPREEGSALLAEPPCLGPECDCLPLGDVAVVVERPRACEIEVRVVLDEAEFSPDQPGPLAVGEPIERAGVFGLQMGSGMVPISTAGACNDAACAQTTDADGRSTISVAVLGDAPNLRLAAQGAVAGEGFTHYYGGVTDIAACRTGESRLEGTVEIRAGHTVLYPPELWRVPKGTTGGAGGCACRSAGGPASPLALLGVFGVLGLAVRRRW